MQSLYSLAKAVNICKPYILKFVPNKQKGKLRQFYVNEKIKKLKKIKKEKFIRKRNEDGINFIGSIDESSGLGQSARLVLELLKNTHYPVNVKNISFIRNDFKQEIHSEKATNSGIEYNINLIHIKPQNFADGYMKLGQEAFDYKYNIAFWLWETEVFPKEWEACFSLIDEVWTPSEFVSNSIRKMTKKTVRTMPYVVTVNNEKKGRQYFGLPENKFIFLTMYDVNSIPERKNPIGTMQAFNNTFTMKDDAMLVIKVGNATNEEIKKIHDFMDGKSNYTIIDSKMEKQDVDCLIECADVLVSLHRSEGYGLVLAEAMLLGTPCIATNWSANVEFMTKEDSCLVDYSLISIKETLGPYTKGTKWADPDINSASYYMKKLYSDKEYYQDIKDAAQKKANILFEKHNALEKIEATINEIYDSV